MADEPKTFSEDQVAAMRRKYESQASDAGSKATAKLLSDLGYDDADSLNAFLSDTRDKAEAGRTDLEKAQREIKKLQGALEKEQQAHTGTRQAWHGKTVKSAIVGAAAAAKANDPQDFYFRLREQVQVGDDGEPVGADGASVEDLVAKVAAESPHLVQAAGGDGANSLPGEKQNHQPDLSTPEGRIAHMEAQGVKF